MSIPIMLHLAPLFSQSIRAEMEEEAKQIIADGVPIKPHPYRPDIRRNGMPRKRGKGKS